MNKPTKNFHPSLKKDAEEFIRYGAADKDKFNFVTKFPCWKCKGLGIIRDWSGIGSDYREEHCRYCGKTGIVSKHVYQDYYEKRVAAYKKAMEVYQKKEQKYKAATVKLTKDELKTILDFHR